MLSLIWIFLFLSLQVLFWFVIVFWCFQIYYTINKDTIGLVPTASQKVLDSFAIINSEFGIVTENTKFVEIGAGLANVSGWVSKNHNFQEVIGVEIDGLTVLFAKIWNLWKRQKVNLIRKNVFNYEIPKGSVVYSYLTPNVLDKLYQQKKLNGSLIISLTFSINNLEPDWKIQLKSPYNRLLVWDLRHK